MRKVHSFHISRRPDPDYEPWFADVWVVPAEGGEPRKVTKSEGPSGAPRWTPDGKFIIYGGHRMEHGGPTLTKLWKVPAEGGEPVCLTPNFDQSLGDRCAGDSKLGGGNNGPTLSPDGKTIYFLSSARAVLPCTRCPLTAAILSVLGGDREIYGFTMDDSGKSVAMVVKRPTFPGDLYSVNLDTKAEKVLTASNKICLNRCISVTWGSSPSNETACRVRLDHEAGGVQEGVKYPAVLRVPAAPLDVRLRVLL